MLLPLRLFRTQYSTAKKRDLSTEQNSRSRIVFRIPQGACFETFLLQESTHFQQNVCFHCYQFNKVL